MSDGYEPDDAYMEGYRQSHLSPESVDYRLAYHRIVLLDGILRNYTYLDVGCGTGGYFRLMRNASRITGLDRSPRMLAAAKELAAELDYADKVRFVQSEFENFEPDETYDAIRLGVYGSYEKVTVGSLQRAHRMLRPGGFILIAITPPPSVWQRLRSSFDKSATRMSPRQFERTLDAAGGLEILKASREGRRVSYLLRAGS